MVKKGNSINYTKCDYSTTKFAWICESCNQSFFSREHAISHEKKCIPALKQLGLYKKISEDCCEKCNQCICINPNTLLPENRKYNCKEKKITFNNKIISNIVCIKFNEV